MRVDNLARRLDDERASLPVPRSPLPAFELYRDAVDAYRCTPSYISETFGLLAHYTTDQALHWILKTGAIGPGVWLTTTPYAACMAPYDLGLNTPRDACLLVDVADLDQDLWGPGTALASGTYPDLWRGGALEFYYPDWIELSRVRDLVELDPCGDAH